MRIPLLLSAGALCLALFHTPASAGPIPTGKPVSFPDWWFEQDAIPRLAAASTKPNPVWPTDYAAADDFAAANVGQLKYIASKAAADFSLRLPGGPGSAIQTLIDSWSQAPGAGVTRNDYAAINQGQVKTISKLFYDRLAVFGYTWAPLSAGQTYPWSSTTTDDDAYATANLGQLKLVFSFDTKRFDTQADTDSDGLPDFWERGYFGSISTQTRNGDADGDGLTNRAEANAGTNPTISDPQNASSQLMTIFSP